MTTLHEEPLGQRALMEENEDSYSDPECNDYDAYEVRSAIGSVILKTIFNSNYSQEKLTQKSALKGRLSASRTMDSLMDYSNAGPIFSTQITNNVNGTYLHNQGAGVAGLNQQPGSTNMQAGTNSLLKNVIGTPSMSSSTSSGYGSQAVSLGNLTSDDTLSLRSSMSVDETPDLDRSSSASPPVKSNMRPGSETATTPYTPSTSQKRFNPFMKDSVMESSASSTSTLVKTPMTPTKLHPLANSDEEGVEEQEQPQQHKAEPVIEHIEAHKEQGQQEEEEEHDDFPHEVENNNSSEMANKNKSHPLPDWVVVGESVLIRPYNTSGVVSFVGPTHFQVRNGWKRIQSELLINLRINYFRVAFGSE